MELKPCPFCGGKADVTRYYESGVEVGSAIVCNNCGVSVYQVEADCAEESRSCSRRWIFTAGHSTGEEETLIYDCAQV